jgi:hypothetical protein
MFIVSRFLCGKKVLIFFDIHFNDLIINIFGGEFDISR